MALMETTLKKCLTRPLTEWAILGLFCLTAVLVTWPTAVRLNDFAVFATDPLLEAWTLKWDAHSLLAGPAALGQIWDANIFYPYPHTLAFSEHLFSSALILLPFTLLGSTPLAAANLGVLFTTALSGWSMYLLVRWLTGNRQAGLVAGLFFAVAPFRMGHLIQLHLLSTQWIPLAFLAFARLIKLNRSRDLLLLLIFTNLQFFASVNYAPLVALGLGVWAAFYLIAYRRMISASLSARLAIFALVTATLNWPVLRLYQQVSDHMGIVRSLGDAKVYGASLAHYLTPIANSLLYQRWLGWPGLLDSAFPGLVIFGLALAGLVFTPGRLRFPKPLAALLAIVLVGLALSFGANDLAFGEKLAPLAARWLPYPYLYNALPLLQGLRAPVRFALLVTFGLAVLAGFGLAALERRWWAKGARPFVAAVLAGAFVLLEHNPAPLPGVSVPYGSPLYERLAHLPPDTVILELPYYLHTQGSFTELSRVYESARHWRRMVNGGSGFKPAWLVRLGPALDAFPDARSLDVLRQLGVTVVALHHDQVDPAAWDNMLGLLPGYLPAIEAIESVGEDLFLQLRPPTCSPDINQVQVDGAAFPTLTFTNTGPAAWVADPRQPSRWQAGAQSQEFLEPLFVAAGQTVSMTLPITAPDSPWQVDLANQKRNLSSEESLVGRPTPAPAGHWQPVQIPFADGAVLQAAALADGSAHPCGALQLSLQWSWPQPGDHQVGVKLLDRFGRVTVDSIVHPLPTAEPSISTHLLPLTETTPPGQYQLQVQLLASNGQEIPPVGPDGAPVARPIALPVVIRPAGAPAPVAPAAQLENGVSLLKVDLPQQEFHAGEWVRFSLNWQAVEKPPGDFTVFTQFLGPDGKVYGQHDNPPYGGWYLTSLWRPGEVVQDDYAIRLDAAAPAGDYRLVVGMYDSASGQRVHVEQGGDFIEAGNVTVVAP